MIYYADEMGRIYNLGDPIKHYNHNHDALGRFARGAGSVASRTGSRLAYKAALDSLDNRYIKNRGVELRTTLASEKTSRQLSKINKKNRPASYEKKQNKLNKQNKKIATSRSNQKAIEKQINKTIAEANKKGYSVKAIQGIKSSQNGRDLITSYLALRTGVVLAGPIGGAAALVGTNKIKKVVNENKYENRFNGQNPSKIQGNYFKVRKTKSGSKPSVSYEGRYKNDRNLKSRIIGDRVQTNKLYGNEQLTRDYINKNRITRKKKNKR